jgi:hypothetical protein
MITLDLFHHGQERDLHSLEQIYVLNIFAHVSALFTIMVISLLASHHIASDQETHFTVKTTVTMGLCLRNLPLRSC